MSTGRWMELEYKSLREEIILLTESQQATIKFFLPAAAAVYTVPYVLNRTSEPLLWSICAGGAALMLLAMSYTLLSYVEAIFKIGAYIKEAIEPQTNAGLRWESFLYRSHTSRRVGWPTEQVTIAVIAVAANVIAALGAGRIFLKPPDKLFPMGVALLGALCTLPATYRIWRSGSERHRHAMHIQRMLASGSIANVS